MRPATNEKIIIIIIINGCCNCFTWNHLFLSTFFLVIPMIGRKKVTGRLFFFQFHLFVFHFFFAWAFKGDTVGHILSWFRFVPCMTTATYHIHVDLRDEIK